MAEEPWPGSCLSRGIKTVERPAGFRPVVFMSTDSYGMMIAESRTWFGGAAGSRWRRGEVQGSRIKGDMGAIRNQGSVLVNVIGAWLRARRFRVTDRADTGPFDGNGAQPVGRLVQEGRLVRLRRHVPANRAAFQRWYADPEIARLLRHDLEPLNEVQSRGYFDTIILPLSARGLCYAIHEATTDRLIGTTALTDIAPGGRSALFRIVIGEKECWGHGYGTEATRLVMDQAFHQHRLDEVRLEVFRYNTRAINAYRRVGFVEAGEHVEYVGRRRYELHVVEMVLNRDSFDATNAALAS